MSDKKHLDEILICQTTRKVLRYSLLWPKKEEELNPGINYKFTVLAFIITTGILSGSLTVRFYLVMFKYPEASVSEETAIMIAFYGTYFMCYVFVRNQHRIASTLRDFSDFSSFGIPENFVPLQKKIQIGIMVWIFFTVFVIFCYSLLQIAEKEQCQDEDRAIGLNGNHCGLLVPQWVPFDIDYFPMFQVFYLYCAVIGHMFGKMVALISVFVSELAQYIILRIDHLKLMLIEIFDDPSYTESRRRLIRCINYHQEILELADKLDKSFFLCMFGHFLLTGAICGCLEKQVVDGINPYGASLHVCGWLIALFVACFGGQQLINANEVIATTLYDSKWYNADVRLQRDVILILLRSQKDLYIRAGPFGTLSCALFASVLKMSYSILCMLS